MGDAPHGEGDGDNDDAVDVLVVGAGLSGIGAAHHLKAQCPWATVAIVEARGAIGGTWDLFRYPGIRSDSDMYTLGYGFHPWTGARSIADGTSIAAYINEVAASDGTDLRIRFHQRVTHASWSSDRGRWTVSVEHAKTKQVTTIECRFLYCCTGYYRYDHGYAPVFDRQEDFRGTIVHPQAWSDEIDVVDKQVVVVGSGATAITVVPPLAKTAGHVTMLQRSPSYVISQPAVDPLATWCTEHLPQPLRSWVLRWIKALTSQAFYTISRRRPELIKRVVRRQLEDELPEGFDIDTTFTPRYTPWDQRLCVTPDGEFFASIRSGAVSVVTDEIDHFTEHGIRLRSGEEVAADLVVTATGLDLLFLGGIDLDVDGTAIDLAERLVYKGMMLDGIPNLAFAVGYTNASWTLKCELTAGAVCRLLNHMRARGLTSATPRPPSRSVERRPLFDLSSGYVRRSAARLPSQGPGFPWRLHQSYLRDVIDMKGRGVVDGALVFTPSAHRPRPVTEPSADAVS